MDNDTVILQLLSQQELRRLTPLVCYLATIGVIGILGNGMALLVYLTRFKQSNSQCFLWCLSTIDLFTCFIVIPMEIYTIVQQYTFPSSVVCKFYIFFSMWATGAAAFLLVLIAVDRYMKICRPFSRQITVKRTKQLVGAILTVTSLLSCPSFVLYGRNSVSMKEYNVSSTECKLTGYMIKTSFPLVYNAIYWLLTVLGVTSLIILYYRIVQTVRLQERRKAKIKMLRMSSKRNRESVVCSDQINKDQSRELVKPDPVVSNSVDGITDNVTVATEEFIHERNDEVTIGTTTNRRQRWQKVTLSCDEDYLPSPSDSDLDLEVNIELVQIKDKYETAESNIEECQAANAENNDELHGLPTTEKSNELQQSDDSEDNADDAIDSKELQVSMKSVDQRTGTQTSKSANVRQRHSNKTTLIMSLVTICAVLSYIPYLILASMRAIVVDFEEEMSDLQRSIYKSFLRSYFLNAMVNPFIYGACDVRFRKALFDIIRGK